MSRVGLVAGLAGLLVLGFWAQAGSALAFVSVDAGGLATCAVRANGEAVCWGDNSVGQLGDGTKAGRSVPAPVQGLTGVAGVATNGISSCAVHKSGGVLCWGLNQYGELGDGTTTQRLLPVPVVGLNDARSIAISRGGQHVCAVRESGQAVCWGRNNFGQLGDGTVVDRLTPTPVTGLTDAASIATGAGQTCAIRRSGQAVCWGNNESGQLGDGTMVNRLTPAPVQGLGDTRSIATAVYHSCAVRSTGEAVCWGSNADGLLGDGSTVNRLEPVAVEGLSDAASIAASQSFSCSVRQTGQSACWGNNGSGQLGDGTTTSRRTPVPVAGLTDSVTISLGPETACVRRGLGQAACWGRNIFGQLGTGDMVDKLTPALVIQPFDLRVASTGDGSGRVTSLPAGIACGEACESDFVAGTGVELTARPAEDSIFAGWTGACSGTGPCRVVMNNGASVGASFVRSGIIRRSALEASVKPRKKAVKPGRTATFRVRVESVGNIPVTGVKACASGPERQVRIGRCFSLGTIAPGRTRTATFRVSAKKSASSGRRARLIFRVRSQDGEKQDVRASLRIR